MRGSYFSLWASSTIRDQGRTFRAAPARLRDGTDRTFSPASRTTCGSSSSASAIHKIIAGFINRLYVVRALVFAVLREYAPAPRVGCDANQVRTCSFWL